MRASHDTLVVGVRPTEDVNRIALELHATFATTESGTSEHNPHCDKQQNKHNSHRNVHSYCEANFVCRLLLHKSATSDYGHNAKYCKDYA
jgi:hypothetical protein